MRRFVLKPADSASAALCRTRAVLVLQQREGRLQRRAPRHSTVEAERRHRLVEQAVPGRRPGRRSFPRRAAPACRRAGTASPCGCRRARACNARIRRLRRHRDAASSSRFSSSWKNSRSVDGDRHLVLRVRVEFRARRVGRVAGIDEAGVAHDAPERVVDRLVAADCLDQAAVAGEGFELPLIVGRKGRAFGEDAFHVVRKDRRVHRGVEVGEVPLRQVAEV